MMAKPIKALELHYPMIQFLMIITIIYKPVVPGFLAFLYHLYLLDDPKKQIRYFKTTALWLIFKVILT